MLHPNLIPPRRASCVKWYILWCAQLLLWLGQAKQETVDTAKDSEKEGNAFAYSNSSYKVQQVWEGVRPCADMNAQ